MTLWRRHAYFQIGNESIDLNFKNCIFDCAYGARVEDAIFEIKINRLITNLKICMTMSKHHFYINKKATLLWQFALLQFWCALWSIFERNQTRVNDMSIVTISEKIQNKTWFIHVFISHCFDVSVEYALFYKIFFW